MGTPAIYTPTLDTLAERGVLFNNSFCTTSICCTSRASIFTGMYGRTNGIEVFDKPLPSSLLDQTYPSILRRHGYRTGFVGKYGIGGPLPAEAFDFWEGFPGQGKYFHEVEGETLHLSRLLARKCLAFLDGCSRSQPFCLSVSFKAPHVLDGDARPFQPDPRFEEMYVRDEIPAPATATEGNFRALPEFIRDSEGRLRWERRFATPEMFQSSVKDYYRLITGVDFAVAEILTALTLRDLDRNTVVIFTSDNGFFLGEHGLAGKWLMYEESIRVPLLIYDPRLPLHLRGRRLEEMVLNIDLAPTVLNLAGLESPDSVHGSSLVPLLEGVKTEWRKEWFYEHHYEHRGRIPASEGIRTAEWKYVRYLKSEPLYEQLFSLREDPHEERNLATDPRYGETLAKLRERWSVWNERIPPCESG
jgi:arylsulfatase A-like enzyme